MVQITSIAKSATPHRHPFDPFMALTSNYSVSQVYSKVKTIIDIHVDVGYSPANPHIEQMEKGVIMGDDALAKPANPTMAIDSLAESDRSEGAVLTVTAKSVRDVLPARFYEGASDLALSAEELKILSEFEDVNDEEVDIRADGFIYVSHMYYRRALNKIFGPGQWTLLPGSPIALDKEKNQIYRTWVLVVRKHYIGEAIGWATYYANNARANWSDAAEITRSDAISKIASKNLGIGVNVYNKRFAAKWRQEYCTKVKVKDRHGNVDEAWRRTDADPFENEISDTPEPQRKSEKAARKAENGAPAPSVPQDVKQAEPARAVERTTEPLPAKDEVIDQAERERLQKAAFGVGWALHELKAYLAKHYNLQAIGDVKKSQLETIISEVQAGGKRD